MKFTYTTRTGDPKDTTYGYAYDIYTADTDGPSGGDINKCGNKTPSGNAPRVSPGVYNHEYTADCTWTQVKYCASCSWRVNFNSSFTFTTFNPGGIAGFWIVARTSYGPAPDLRLTVADPNCASPSDLKCDGAFLDRSSLKAGVSQSPGTLKNANAVRTGVAADGVTLLLLQARIPEAKATGQSVRFALKNASGAAADSKWGVLLNRDGTGETESQLVFDRIVQLLKSSINDSSDFAPFQAYTAPAGVAVRVPAPCPAGITTPIETNATVTITPTAGTVVKPGDTVVMSMSISGGNAVEGALFAAATATCASPAPARRSRRRTSCRRIAPAASTSSRGRSARPERTTRNRRT
jgi:hypothetical protein